ncbi:hypothetical protein GOP47_0018288, partial [Adiantum capillus-veneris]
MAHSLANNFAHPLVGSFAMKDSMLFGCYGGEGELNEGNGGGGGDDMLGELREEEIVWGEAESMSHHHKEAGSGEKTGTKISGGRNNQAMERRHRSMLSRQTEMQASTWTSGDRMLAAMTCW